MNSLEMLCEDDPTNVWLLHWTLVMDGKASKMGMGKRAKRDGGRKSEKL